MVAACCQRISLPSLVKIQLYFFLQLGTIAHVLLPRCPYFIYRFFSVGFIVSFAVSFNDPLGLTVERETELNYSIVET